jgi:hypothetical protein
LNFAIPLFSCLVRWHEGDSLWEVALPCYSLHPEHEYVWTALPVRYCVDDNLLRVIAVLLRARHDDAVLHSCHVYFLYGDDVVELNEDDAIMDVLIRYCDI